MENKKEQLTEEQLTEAKKNEADKRRWEEIKKTNMLLNQNANPINFAPRSKSIDNKTPESGMIIPSGKTRAKYEQKPMSQTLTNEAENPPLIQPRKENERTPIFTKQVQQEIEKTFFEVKEERQNQYNDAQREEKKLLKEQKKLFKIVEKNDNKINRMISRGQEEDDNFLNTLEIQSSFVERLENNNDNINEISNQYGGTISLSKRRKKIQKKSLEASTKRVQEIMDWKINAEKTNKVNELEKFKKNISSLYLRQKLKNSKFTNPYLERMQRINERGGVTDVIDGPIKQDRIAEKWLERAYNIDEKGKVKPSHLNTNKEKIK